MGKRISLRVFRWTAVLLATAGLGLLYLMSVNREVPVVKIAEIRPTMNFAYVRLIGRVTGDTRTQSTEGALRSLRFTVDDGTGEMNVVAYRHQAKAILDAGLAPRLGDHVEVAGSLGISADQDGPILRLQSPDQLHLTRTPPRKLKLAEVTMDHAGGLVEVSGRISSIKVPETNTTSPWNVII